MRMEAPGKAGRIGWNYGTNEAWKRMNNAKGSLPAGNGGPLQKRRKTPIHRFKF